MLDPAALLEKLDDIDKQRGEHPEHAQLSPDKYEEIRGALTDAALRASSPSASMRLARVRTAAAFKSEMAAAVSSVMTAFRKGPALNRHCEERSDEAIQGRVRRPGLLRFARNDEVSASRLAGAQYLSSARPVVSAAPAGAGVGGSGEK